MQKESRIQAFFLHVFMCSVLFDAVRQTELYLTSSVQFGQNRKTPLQSVTSIYSCILQRKNFQAFCLLQIFLSDIRTTFKIQNFEKIYGGPWEKTQFQAFSLRLSMYWTVIAHKKDVVLY